MIKITGSVLAIIPVAFKPVGLCVLSSAYILDGNGQHIFPGGTSGPLPDIAESHSPSLAEHCTCQGLAGCLSLLRSSHPVPGPRLITHSASVPGSCPGLNNCKITMTLIGSLAMVWRVPDLCFFFFFLTVLSSLSGGWQSWVTICPPRGSHAWSKGGQDVVHSIEPSTSVAPSAVWQDKYGVRNT